MAGARPGSAGTAADYYRVNDYASTGHIGEPRAYRRDAQTDFLLFLLQTFQEALA
jgi:hypothetical protein